MAKKEKEGKKAAPKKIIKKKRVTVKKKKLVYTLVAPQEFNNIVIGKTFAKDPKALIGRTILVSMKDLTGKIRQRNRSIKFIVTDVKGENAHTEIYEQTLSRNYLRRLTRRQRSKIDVIQDVVTKDRKKVRLKTVAFTGYKITKLQQTLIRKAIIDSNSREARKMSYIYLMQAIIEGKLSNAALGPSKKIAPIRKIEIRNTKASRDAVSRAEAPETKNE